MRQESISQEDVNDVLSALAEGDLEVARIEIEAVNRDAVSTPIAESPVASAEVARVEVAQSNGAAIQDALSGALDTLTSGIATGLVAGATLLVGSQVVLRAGVWMQPRPMPHQQAALLEHPWRLRYRNPTELLGLVGVFTGMNIVDLGCGTGLFTLEMAQRVGESGKVHAVDIQAQMIAQCETRVAAAGLSQRVKFYHSGIHTLPLADKSVDLAFMAAVLGELPARALALDEVRRVLKPGARLAISEELPDPAYAPAPLVRRWAEEAGFRYGGLTGNPFCYTMLLFAD